MNWLDTETKAMLGRTDEPKLAPPAAAEFGLVLLRKGTEEERLVKAIRQIKQCTEFEAAFLGRLPVPIIVNPGITEADVFFGQFELICCDAISIFIRTEVLLEQDDDYLNSLYEKTLESPEFRQVTVNVVDVPATEAGQRFLEQFLGVRLSLKECRAFCRSVSVAFKKARIMKHWAARIEGSVRCDAVQDSGLEADIV